MVKLRIWPSLVILIVAWLLMADLWWHPGRSLTFDGHVHITTMAQFHDALADGEWWVRWANGFANYGHPLGLVAHQTTSYLGGLMIFAVSNPVTAYNSVMWLGAAGSTWLWWLWLQRRFSEPAALTGAVLFNFAPYRIVNIFVRGAIPEFFASLFVPVLLLGLDELWAGSSTQPRRGQVRRGILLTAAAVAGLALTHPMMLLITGVVVGPVGLNQMWCWWRQQPQLAELLQRSVLSVAAATLGLLLASYYLVPLTLELKYFQYGGGNHFRPENAYFNLSSYFVDTWQYFNPSHPGPRSETLSLGSLESIVIIITVVIWIVSLAASKKLNQRWPVLKQAHQLTPWMVVIGLALFLMLPPGQWLYQHITLLSNIQYPWRNLAAAIWVAPFFTAWLLHQLPQPHLRWRAAIGLIGLIALLRAPQLYGKNFLLYSTDHYHFITANLHTNNLNTLWMGTSSEYPTKTQQSTVIEGSGQLQVMELKNASRRYQFSGDSPSRIIDYTFYFPGWRVLVDGQEIEIQWQDPNYRGVITYWVPAGDHQIEVRFGLTKIRVAGVMLTGGALVSMMLLLYATHFYYRQPR